MKFWQKHIFLLTIVLALVSVSLSAAQVEATYTSETDTTIYDDTYFGLQSLSYPVALHVGRLEIKIIGNGSIPSLYSLQISRSGSYGGGAEYWLTSSEMINWQNRFGAQLVAKIQFGSTTIVKSLSWGTGEGPLTNGKTIYPSDYPVTIDFYLGIRNIHNAAQASGASFQFENGATMNLGSFTIQYQENNNSNSSFHDIPFDDVGTTTKPFFDVDYSDEEENDNYLNQEVVDQTIYVLFDIEQETYQQSIDLLDASGTSKAKIGQARLTLSGYESSNIPGVSLTFTDTNGSTDTDFRLKHTGMASYIPFSLYLGGAKVERGVPTTWDNLTFAGPNLKDLEVGDISYQDATSYVGGSYTETITVNITSSDESSMEVQ